MFTFLPVENFDWHSSNLLIWDKEENHSGISDTKRAQLYHDILVPAETVCHKLAQVPRKKRYDNLIKCLKRLNTWWERITYVKNFFPFYVSIDSEYFNSAVLNIPKRLTYVWAFSSPKAEQQSQMMSDLPLKFPVTEKTLLHSACPPQLPWSQSADRSQVLTPTSPIKKAASS